MQGRWVPDGRGLRAGGDVSVMREGDVTDVVVTVRTGEARICGIDGCTRVHLARGLCGTHYRRWWKHGDPFVVLHGGGTPPGVNDPSLYADRFWSKVLIKGPDECWLWLGHSTYFSFAHTKNRMTPRRFAYVVTFGGAPWGKSLASRATCDPLCVNPKHLRPETAREIWLRNDPRIMEKANQTHCKHGHPFDELNTYRASNGTRHCRTCYRLSQRRRDGRHIVGDAAVIRVRRTKVEKLSPLARKLLETLT